MARIPNCDFKVDGCDDPKCRRGFCILEERTTDVRQVEEVQRTEELNRYIDKNLENETVRVAKEVLRKKFGRANHDRALMLSNDPRIIAEAKRRLRKRRLG